jgi:hypothetical protein
MVVNNIFADIALGWRQRKRQNVLPFNKETP